MAKYDVNFKLAVVNEYLAGVGGYRTPTGSVQINKLYLDSFMDMFNGKILSYRVTEKPTAKAINEALEEAIQNTSDCPYRRTFHSHQGWAYQMKAYSKKLKDHGIFQSMSRKGNCLDNSPMENFSGILKQ